MSRSTAGSHGVNLLPLLDVLLCTMGTLIVVLGVVNREARLHPTKRLSGKAAAAAEHLQELTDAREELELHIQQLLTAREKTLADLENARVRLSGIEDHSRQIEDQLRSLGAASTQLESADGQKDSEHDALRTEVMQLNARRMELDKALQKARGDAAHQKPVFAVVPFEGIYQTSRRPIYIECRGDSIILQPEGIVFTPTDFLGPGGPGNPLAAALRAAQEYWRQAPAPAPGIPNEPYPLLLVRPDGIIAYYLVRDAMSSWDAEFGYELIGVDWKLAFPMQPEQRLKDMETRAVAEARDRLQWLAQASPETFARKSKTQYRMSSMRGGVVRDGGPSLGNDPFADDPLGGFGKTANAGLASGGGNGAIGRGPLAGGSVAGNTAIGNGTAGKSAFGNGTQGNSGLAGGGFGERGSVGGPGIGGAGLNGVGGGGMTIGDSRYAGQGSGGMGNGGAAAGGMGNGLGGEMPGGGAGALSGSPGSVFGGGGGSTNGTAGGSTAGSSGGPELSNVGPRYAGNGGGSGFGNDQSSAGNRGSSGDQRIGGGGSASRSEYGGVAWPNDGGDNEGWKQGGTAGGASGGTAGSVGNGSSATGQLARSGGPNFGDVAGLSGESGGSDSSGGSSSSGGGSSGGTSASGSTSSGSTTSGQSAGGDSSSMSMGTPTPSINYQANNQQQRNNSSHSLSKNRGRNWALPSSSPSSLPIQRPIRIECYSDRLVLLPDSRDQQAQVIPLTERTDEAVDQLISSVRTYTKSWGMAGRSMYWKPQLVLEVKPNAESRAGDLQLLLADSGLDVVRK